jgi:HSP20 family protein
MELYKFIDKAKDALRRASDRLSGSSAPVREGSLSPESLENRPLAKPAMDAFENDEEYLLRFDAPGATPQNSEIVFSENRTLTVYVRNEAVGREETPLFEQYRSTDWYRAVQLPDNAEGGKAKSSVRDGVLTVRVPKRERPAPRLIPVRAAS